MEFALTVAPQGKVKAHVLTKSVIFIGAKDLVQMKNARVIFLELDKKICYE